MPESGLIEGSGLKNVRGTWGLPLLIIALLAAGCSATPEPVRTVIPGPSTLSPTTTPSATADCTVDAALVPSCGVLWGVSTQPPTVAGVEGIEEKIGRKFDFVYRYHDVNDIVPDGEERALVDRGTFLHLAIASRDFGTGEIPYADIAQGKHDDTLRAQAEGVASLKVPTFVTFEQEANQKDKVGQRGSDEEFIAAWRHLHDLYAEAGATNAVWVWVMTGNKQNLPRTAALWPGNDVVQWISWNIYNQSGCRNNKLDVSKYVSFEEGLRVFHDWVTSAGLAAGIDASKPMMISETGSAQYPKDPQKSAQWYADIPGALKKFPDVKAVGLWASGGGGPNGCDYRFQRNPVITEGVEKAGQELDAGSPTAP